MKTKICSRLMIFADYEADCILNTRHSMEKIDWQCSTANQNAEYSATKKPEQSDQKKNKADRERQNVL